MIKIEFNYSQVCFDKQVAFNMSPVYLSMHPDFRRVAKGW